MGLPQPPTSPGRSEVRAFDIASQRPARRGRRRERRGVRAGGRHEGADVLVAVRNQAQLENLLWGDEGIARASCRAGRRAGHVHGRHRRRHRRRRAPHRGGTPPRERRSPAAPCAPATGRCSSPSARPASAAWALAEQVLPALADPLSCAGERPGDGQAAKTVNELLCSASTSRPPARRWPWPDASGSTRRPCWSPHGRRGGVLHAGRPRPRMLQAYDEGGAEVKNPDRHLRQGHGHREHRRARGRPGDAGGVRGRAVVPARPRFDKGAQDDSSIITVVAPEANP